MSLRNAVEKAIGLAKHFYLSSGLGGFLDIERELTAALAPESAARLALASGPDPIAILYWYVAGERSDVAYGTVDEMKKLGEALKERTGCEHYVDTHGLPRAPAWFLRDECGKWRYYDRAEFACTLKHGHDGAHNEGRRVR